MAGRYSIIVVRDIPLDTIQRNIAADEPGIFLKEPAVIRIYATRETTDVTIGVTIGQDVALPVGSPANISTVIGSLPSRQNDLLVKTGGEVGDTILIQGQNVDGAAARELRVLIDVTPVEDEALLGGRD